MHRASSRKPKTEFGKWLAHNMIEHELSCGEVAEKLGTTRQTVNNHIAGAVSPSYVWVIAYCWVFDSIDHLEEVWNMTKEKAL